MWHFRKKERGEKIRNPIQGEFFATEAIDGPAQALVREAVQNSLDARANGKQVEIRIRLATGDDALSPHAVAGIFENAWNHYSATGNGLRDAPEPSSPCPFLVVEDFGTKGLTGDPGQADASIDTTNPFLLFFRAEGLSAKSGTELGRWGVGKFVFPRSSQTSTHFGLTIRHDDGRRLMLGAATLKAHRVAEDQAMYSPDGLYGRLQTDGFVLPIENSNSLDEFSRVFGLSRKTEPGLSVVVPYVDPEITFERLLFAAIKDYFLPILHGQLRISIKAGVKHVELNESSIDATLVTYENEFEADVTGFVHLARWAAQVKSDERLQLVSPDPARSPKWIPELIPETILQIVREKLARREAIALRVPIAVRPKNRSVIDSYFDIYLAPDKTASGRPMFVREGIIIADVRGARVREIRPLIVIEEKALAGMLGDSENPAHTQWQKDSSNFRGKYVYGSGVIDFVTNSVRDVLSIVTRSAAEADPSLTVEFFSIESPELDSDETIDSEAPRKRPKIGSESNDDPVGIDPRPTRIRVVRSPGGFSIQAGSRPASPPYFIEISCAYDIRSGNPIRKWSPADFELGTTDFPVTHDEGVTLAKAGGNFVLLQVRDNTFHASFAGFDEARDVYVRANVRSSEDAGTQD